GKNSLNRLIRCVCGKKIGPDPRNFNQRVSLGRNDLLIRTFLKRVRQLLSLTFLHEKIQVLVDLVNTCVTDTQPKRIIVVNHGYTFFKRCKMLRR
ncbi:hypothetical protein AB0215_29385, partial [Klebsiella pneumoniae]